MIQPRCNRSESQIRLSFILLKRERKKEKKTEIITINIKVAIFNCVTLVSISFTRSLVHKQKYFRGEKTNVQWIYATNKYLKHLWKK